MMKVFNELCNAILENVQDALPVLIIIIFYQMTVLELPLAETVEMLGWILFLSFGMVMIL